MVSLGCPKALVDSERILTRLRAEGYAISPDYAGADAVIVNTCGFLDSAKAESLEAIGEALGANGRVIVTGCLGADEASSAAPTRPCSRSPARTSTRRCSTRCTPPCRPRPTPSSTCCRPPRVHLTPRHYSYLKISEGCNHKCRFCIIPDMRGRLVSRPAHAVLREAERLVAAGVRELLVISQDTRAYGVDRRHDAHPWQGGEVRSHITDLARELGSLGAWVRLHYVYPYPHVRELIPLMAEGLVLPYLDIPFQHAHPDVLRRMARPAAAPGRSTRSPAGAPPAPSIALRSTFIVGYPGETEAEFAAPARLARRGPARPRRRLQVRERRGRPRQRPARPRARGGQGGALGALHGEGAGDQRRQARGPRRHPHRGHRRRGRRRGRHLPHPRRRPRDRRQPLHRRGFRGLQPGDILTVEVEEADDYDLWGRGSPNGFPDAARAPRAAAGSRLTTKPRS